MKELLERPHLIFDSNGKLISAFSPASVASRSPSLIMNRAGQTIAKIACEENALNNFEAWLAEETEELEVFERLQIETRTEILRGDIQGMLEQTSQQTLPLDELLLKICQSLRTHFQTRAASIFGLIEGHKLEGLFAAYSGGIKGRDAEWNLGAMNLAAHVVDTKRTYVSMDPENDTNYRKVPGHPIPKNILVAPLFWSGTLVGILNLTDKSNGEYSAKDHEDLRIYSSAVGHMLRGQLQLEHTHSLEKNRDDLSKYLSKNVVRKIDYQGSGDLKDGVKRHTVVLFSDIRGFTSLSRDVAPEILVRLLNEYFEAMSKVIDEYGGTLDKIVGDLMMVLWNVPLPQPDPEVLAVKCAFEMQKTIRAKVEPLWRQAGVEGFGVGIGINAGEAVTGNMGSSKFMNFTAIGPNVNLAQRIESECRAGEVWVHASLLSKLVGNLPSPARVMNGVKLKGLGEPVSIGVFLPNA